MVSKNNNFNNALVWQRVCCAIVMLLSCSIGIKAQRATISDKTGHLVSAKTTTFNENSANYEQGFDHGFSSMWKHNQLPLTISTTDQNMPDSAGLVRGAGNNMKFKEMNGKTVLLLCAGAKTCHMTVALPRGFRITSYRIVLENNCPGEGDSDYSTFGEDNYRHPGDDWYFSEASGNYTKEFNRTLFRQRSADEIVLTRTSTEKDYMSNTIHFMFGGNFSMTTKEHTNISMIAIKSFEITYAPDVAFTEHLEPTAVTKDAVAYMTSDFSSEKLDLGEFQNFRATNSQGVQTTYFSYLEKGVKPLSVSNVIYAKNAVSDSENSSYTDNANQAEAKTITGVEDNGKMYFALKPNTYFVETPTVAKARGTAADGSSSNTYPVGYRITGAKINYHYRKAQEARTVTSTTDFYIYSYTSNPNKKKNKKESYMSIDRTLYNDAWEKPRTIWKKTPEGYLYYNDKDLGRLYLHNYNNMEYNRAPITKEMDRLILLGDSRNALVFLEDKDMKLRAQLPTGKPVYFSYRPGRSTTSHIDGKTIKKTQGDAIFRAIPLNKGMDYNDLYLEPVTYKEEAVSASGNCVLKVYDKEGKSVIKTVELNENTPDGTVELTGLNNDAVKFEVVKADGSTDDVTALVNVDLTLEPLNPYVTSTDVVCTRPDGTSLRQRLVTDDFNIGGDKFTFYSPTDFINTDQACDLSFENLFSIYGDDTYNEHTNDEEFAELLNPTHKMGSSRYSYIKSNFWNGLEKDSKQRTNLYLTVDRKSGYISESDYKTRIKTDQTGTKPYKFNNMADLKNTNTEANNKGYLHETLFYEDVYTQQGGAFKKIKLKDKETATFYLFTTDEPRYNIAPTKGMQHRYMAYYQATIGLVLKDYIPVVKWTKLYDKTYYYDKETSTNKFDSFWGVELTAKAKDVTGDHIDDINGSLTIDQIKTALDKDIDEAKKAGITAETAPKSLKNVLYVDASKLYSLLSRNNELETLDKAFAVNSLFFMPVNATYNRDNFVSKTEIGGFLASNNIVLKDKQPFYSPYDIQVGVRNFARYDREQTTVDNGSVIYSTLVLPFGVSINSDGKNLDPINKKATTFYQFAKGKVSMSFTPSSEDKSGKDYKGNLQLDKLSTSTGLTEPNMPYLVQIEKGNAGAQSEYSILQFQATVKSTKDVAGLTSSTPTISGEKYEGTWESMGYSVVSKSSFSGLILNKEGNDKVFYYNKDKFVALKNLKRSKLYVYPFRAYIEFVPKTERMSVASFSVNLPHFFDNTITAIDNVFTSNKADSSLIINTINGAIVLTALNDTPVVAHTLTGGLLHKCELKAGESITIEAPRGVYLINRTKVMVN